jgi:tripartite ATP-independent transporter DctP family solute receptor
MKQGVVDGQENPIGTIYDLKLYETQKYMSTLNSTYVSNFNVISKRSWDKLTPEQQKILIEGSGNAAKAARKLLRAGFLVMLPQRMYSGTTGFTLPAIPFFILAGNLMNVGGNAIFLITLPIFMKICPLFGVDMVNIGVAMTVLIMVGKEGLNHIKQLSPPQPATALPHLVFLKPPYPISGYTARVGVTPLHYRWRCLMKFRNSLAGLALAVGALGMMSTPVSALELKAADVHPEGYPNVVAMQNLGKKLEAATSGRLTLKMFPGAILGDEKAMIEQTQVGAIAILRTSLGPVGPVVPEVNVFNMPFVFRDEAHMRKVIDGEIGNELLAKINASPAKMVALGWMDGGTRSLYLKKAVKTPADLKGQKVRMMGNPLFIDTMNAMGGNGIAMGFGELYSALQTGVVDGAENNPPTYFTQNHHTVAKYYSLTGHLIIPEIFVMSKVVWDKLSADDQALMKKLAREAQMEQRELWDKKVAESVDGLKKAGVEFVEVDKKAFYDLTAPVREKYGKEYAELIKRIEAVK